MSDQDQLTLGSDREAGKLLEYVAGRGDRRYAEPTRLRSDQSHLSLARSTISSIPDDSSLPPNEEAPTLSALVVPTSVEPTPSWLEEFSPRSDDDLALLASPGKGAGSNGLELSRSEPALSPDSPTGSTATTVTASLYKSEGLGDFLTDVREFGSWSRKSGMQLGERPSTPKKHFLGQCEELGLVPEPLLARVVEESRQGTFVIEGYRIGNAMMLALAKSVSMMAVREVNIADNRANDETMCTLLHELNDHEQPALQNLVLSRNTLGRRSVPELAELLSVAPSLKSIELEGNQINDSALRQISSSLTVRTCAVTSLVLCRNKIGDVGAIAFAENLSYMRTLESLDLSWNQIGWRGGKAIAEALETCRLKTLDVSWNAFGSSTDTERSCAKMLSTALGNNTRLVHADIGHNNFTAADCALIAEKLRDNHTLMGLHLEGDATLDASGFLSVVEPSGPTFHKVESHIFTRILRPRIRNKDKWTPVSNCWICEKWTERLFVWNIENSPCKESLPGDWGEQAQPNPPPTEVYMCASYDGWTPQKMGLTSARDKFEDYRMVPPGKHFYFFIVGEEKTYASDQPTTQTSLLPPSMQCRRGAIKVGDEVILATGTKEKNGLLLGQVAKVKAGADANGGYTLKRLEDGAELSSLKADDLRAILPETVNSFVEEENESAPSLQPRLLEAVSPDRVGSHGPWRFETSVFSVYKQDSEKLLADAFARDFAYTNIPSLKGIKNDPEELEQVKEVLKKHYSLIKGVFKQYAAAFSSEVFNLGANGLNEILSVSQIIDEATPCNRTEADMLFISCNLSGPKDKKLNPKRALCRFQFFQLMTNLALSKFYKSGVEATPSAAIERFMTECLSLAEWDDGQAFRTAVIYNEEVDEVIKTFKDALATVYSKNIGEEQGPTERKTMCIREWQALLDKAGLMDGVIMGDRSCRLCYVRAKETSADELTDKMASRKMEIHEFYEAICRVAFQIKTYPDSPKPFVKHLTDVVRALADTLKKKKATGDLPPPAEKSPRSARSTPRGGGGDGSK
jgi:hypothetical protein